jgi:hypothetical protein
MKAGASSSVEREVLDAADAPTARFPTPLNEKRMPRVIEAGLA